MEETPDGTPVGVDDPYDHAETCDHLTDDGRCRYALNHAGADREFARERRAEDYACVAADEDAEWTDCPHYRSTTDGKACTRCGLDEVRMAHDDTRPLIEEHHLSYGDGSNDDSSPATDRDSPADTGFSSLTDAIPQRTLDDARDNGGSNDTDNSGNSNDTDNSSNSNDAGTPDEPSHEITVALCRWCHAKVHNGWARIDDDVEPDPEAIAERESRRSTELEEAGFSTAADRFDAGGDNRGS
jgi:hypothetical protein